MERTTCQVTLPNSENCGDKMDITNVVVEGGTAWCKWQVGDIVGAGLISFGEEGVTQEQLFYF